MRDGRAAALIVLDGWGIAPAGPGNAVSQARTPYWNALTARWPMARLRTDGEAVGLTDGQMGNSNVGHLNIGAGRVVYQDLPRISRAIAQGELDRNPVFKALRQAPRVHLMGLLSPGGVHSHLEHAVALVRFLKGQAVFVHAILDGRDVPPRSARASLESLEAVCRETGARIATVGGRYYAMDRDRRWDRVEKAYDAIVRGRARRASSALEALEMAYQGGEDDEFVVPTLIDWYDGAKAQDQFFFWNFRADRAREISRAIGDPAFDAFRRPEGAFALSAMTEYDPDFALPRAFGPMSVENTLGEVVSQAGLTQLRMAETEKYAHVTYFLNGGREQPFAREDRVLVPSPKVTTYDLQPEMSAGVLTSEAVHRVRRNCPDLLVLNYANADMVAHTGSIPAAVAAIEAVDRGLSELVPALLDQGAQVLLIADHGNAEEMIDERGGPQTSHSRNLVPVLLAGANPGQTLRDGILADVAPTLLGILGLPTPEEMTGESLIVKESAPR